MRDDDDGAPRGNAGVRRGRDQVLEHPADCALEFATLLLFHVPSRALLLCHIRFWEDFEVFVGAVERILQIVLPVQDIVVEWRNEMSEPLEAGSEEIAQNEGFQVLCVCHCTFRQDDTIHNRNHFVQHDFNNVDFKTEQGTVNEKRNLVRVLDSRRLPFLANVDDVVVGSGPERS